MADSSGSKPEYRCDECNFTCSREVTFKCHLEIHSGDRLRENIILCHLIYCLNNLWFSVEWILALTVLKCDLCGYLNESHRGLLCHMRQSHDVAPKVCTECGTVFTEIKDLEEHLRSSHGMEQLDFLCSFCGKLSISEDKHLRHIGSHVKTTDGKPKKDPERDRAGWHISESIHNISLMRYLQYESPSSP